MLPVIARVLADDALVATLLFATAGTFRWPRAWVLLAVMIAIRLAGVISAYRVNPALMRDRASLPIHAEQSWSDRVLVASVIATGFIGLWITSGLDVFRWHLLPPPPLAVSVGGLLLLAAGWTTNILAVRTNAFAAAVVRVQRERAHVVVRTGVYGVVRHPLYAGSILICVGSALWLGSYASALFAVVPISLLVVRIILEERLLRRELAGYNEYAASVRYRLVPGLW
jgi:protein-S-isoprenylcysteine O-methyltransferase Ste14